MTQLKKNATVVQIEYTKEDIGPVLEKISTEKRLKNLIQLRQFLEKRYQREIADYFARQLESYFDKFV